ncbi:DUF6773 family protein [Desulfosporosinus sp. FKA]|uniref:DUF6773 family protein n=1 Tax=Desulfosporosinus sp. FKA TaxID=1969834 RepID=UPI000B4997A0|nr:DUF6773 family protein [Desulfosporosinus sp. FKA]
MKDERIEQAKNKIRSEIAVIIYVGIAISFAVKTLLFKMNLQECMTEYLILIFFPVYEVIRMNMMKVSIYSVNPKYRHKQLKTLSVFVILFFVVAAVSVFSSTKGSTVNLSQSSIVFLVIFIVLFIGVFFLATKYHQSRAYKYEKEFDDNEPEE